MAMLRGKNRLFIRLGHFFEGAAEGPFAIVALVAFALVVTRGLGWW
jgi:hypothetical protein